MEAFEKYDFYIEKNDEFQRFTMQVGDSRCGKVVLTVIDEVTLITGDYGNWVIDRIFIPSAGDKISVVDYALRSVRQSSTQVTHSFDGERILEQCKELREDWESYVSKQDKDEFFEYIESIERNSGDLYDFVVTARDYPRCFPDPFDFFDIESEINPQILYIFHCFDEMCRRLENPVDKWNKLSENKPLNGQLCKIHRGAFGGIQIAKYNSELDSFEIDNQKNHEIWWKAEGSK